MLFELHFIQIMIRYVINNEFIEHIVFEKIPFLFIYYFNSYLTNVLPEYLLQSIYYIFTSVLKVLFHFASIKSIIFFYVAMANFIFKQDKLFSITFIVELVGFVMYLPLSRSFAILFFTFCIFCKIFSLNNV